MDPDPPTMDVDELELQEQRFNEEIQRLSNLDEVIRLSNARVRDSDEESIEGAGVDALLGFESDEDELEVGFPDFKCPRPAPMKGRGGNKYLKRNLGVAVSKKEFRQMRSIIRTTMRKSLTSNITGPKRDDEYGSDSDDSIDGDGNVDAEPPAQNEEEIIMYRNLWSLLSTQRKMVEEKSKLVGQNLEVNVEHNHGLAKQLYIEHVSWLSIVCKQDFNNITQDGLLAWLPGFKEKQTQKFPELAADDARPRSNSALDTLLQIACTKALARVTEVLDTMIQARTSMLKLIDLLDKVDGRKRNICLEFEQIHDDLTVRSAKYDESSVWGMKPIRLAIEPPYFKSEDGLMACPMTPDAEIRMRLYSMSFFKRDKQKWTTKDLAQLKSCIKETLTAKRLGALCDRYEVLMADCVRRYEEEMKTEGRFNAPPSQPFKKKRGRPKRSELESTSRYGVIYPVIAVLPNGAVVRNRVTPKLLADWRIYEEKQLKSKSYEELVYLERENVDWMAVASKMVFKSRKHRTGDDCELAWRHEVHPSVNDKRWGAEEGRRLKNIYEKHRATGAIDWHTVAAELNVPTSIAGKPARGRTPYQCFFRIRNRIDPPKKLVWNPNLDNQVLEKLKVHPGNWRLVAASLNDETSTKRQVIERYKKTINPVLRNGAFTRVEDCLLLLTIEKLKSFLAREGHFGCLLAYLPWRCETTWRDRANNLFSDWIVPWTLEEDKKLLDLAESMNRNWQKISEEFTSFKNRKGCLTRFKILNRRLKDERFNNSLEEYHEAYAMTRYNVFQYKHLKEILDLLKKVRQHPLPKEHSTFLGLLRDREPSEVRLQHMLLTFDREVLQSTINSLSRYVETRDNYWRNWINQHGKRKRTFDRRTFHQENPQSVASAIHIRGLELKEKRNVRNISDFEDEIYKFYGRFRRTKALNEDTKRPYIPDAKTLAKWSAISRIIATPVDELVDEPLKRKWRCLKPDPGLVDKPLKRKSKSSKDADPDPDTIKSERYQLRKRKRN